MVKMFLFFNSLFLFWFVVPHVRPSLVSQFLCFYIIFYLKFNLYYDKL